MSDFLEPLFESLVDYDDSRRCQKKRSKMNSNSQAWPRHAPEVPEDNQASPPPLSPITGADESVPASLPPEALSKPPAREYRRTSVTLFASESCPIVAPHPPRRHSAPPVMLQPRVSTYQRSASLNLESSLDPGSRRIILSICA